MAIQLSPRVLYLTREDWGADTSIPRLGGPEDPRRPGGYPLVPRSERIYDITHHTVIIDSDTSRNVWETLDEVKAQMRRLQRIRPDLGLDVPYNFVVFLMADGTIIVCEGRGYDRSGAHTAGVDAQGRYFNVSGVAQSFQGNFEDYPIDIWAWLPGINDWNAHKKRTFLNLGTANVCGQMFCGHRDHSRFSSLNATACPGQHLYRRLGLFTYTPAAPEEEIDMATADELRSEFKAEDEQTRLFFANIARAHANDIIQLYAGSRGLQAICVELKRQIDALQPTGVDTSALNARLEETEEQLAAIEGRLRAAAAVLAPD